MEQMRFVPPAKKLKPMLILNKSAVSDALSHGACIDVMAEAMKSVSQRDVVMPLRQFMGVPGTEGKLGLMPGYLGAPRCFGVKIVSKFPRDADSPFGTHVGAIMLFDADEGIPVALLDGGELTAIRTAAASALATRVLARNDASTLAVLGHGEQARHHIKALLHVRPIKRILIWGRSFEKASAFVQSLGLGETIDIAAERDAATAVSRADIVCTVTSATTPIIEGAWLEDGTHVNLVGAAVRTSAEADVDVITRSKFYVDYRESALAQAGELLNAIETGKVSDRHIAGEIGEVLLSQAKGRESDKEITVYKSLGVSAQDLAASLHAWQSAKAGGHGTTVDW